MTITLINCKSKLLAKGIDVTIPGWNGSLTSALQSYATFEGWDYDYALDMLRLYISGTVTVPANIVDFGDGREVELG